MTAGAISLAPAAQLLDAARCHSSLPVAAADGLDAHTPHRRAGDAVHRDCTGGASGKDEASARCRRRTQAAELVAQAAPSSQLRPASRLACIILWIAARPVEGADAAPAAEEVPRYLGVELPRGQRGRGQVVASQQHVGLAGHYVRLRFSTAGAGMTAALQLRTLQSATLVGWRKQRSGLSASPPGSKSCSPPPPAGGSAPPAQSRACCASSRRCCLGAGTAQEVYV